MYLHTSFGLLQLYSRFRFTLRSKLREERRRIRQQQDAVDAFAAAVLAGGAEGAVTGDTNHLLDAAYSNDRNNNSSWGCGCTGGGAGGASSAPPSRSTYTRKHKKAQEEILSEWPITLHNLEVQCIVKFLNLMQCHASIAAI